MFSEICDMFVCFSYGIAAIAPFSHRLAFDNLSMDIQRLRCKVNFQALVFVPHIRQLGDALVSRLRYPSGKSGAVGTNYLQESTVGAGKFVVLHLRFDKVCHFISLSLSLNIYIYIRVCVCARACVCGISNFVFILRVSYPKIWSEHKVFDIFVKGKLLDFL